MLPFAIGILLLTILSFMIHELGHGLAGAALGYDMIVRLNSARPVTGGVTAAWHADVIIAAGPVVTILQGFIGAALTVWAQWRAAFWIALTALSMRLLGAGVSAINPNDEAKLGLSWGLGYWTVHAAVAGVLVLLVLWAARSARPGWGKLGIAVLMIMVGMAVAVGIERHIPALTIAALR